jgi:hypothetical protein
MTHRFSETIERKIKIFERFADENSGCVNAFCKVFFAVGEQNFCAALRKQFGALQTG